MKIVDFPKPPEPISNGEQLRNFCEGILLGGSKPGFYLGLVDGKAIIHLSDQLSLMELTYLKQILETHIQRIFSQ